MSDAINIELCRAALAYIPASLPRDDWARIGMAIKSEYPEDVAFELFDTWSASADNNYSNKDARDTWKSIKADGGILEGRRLE